MNREEFLLEFLLHTSEYPQFEFYLKDLLNYFTVDELGSAEIGWSVLHYMSVYSCQITLNAFEIVINYGVNINMKCRLTGSTAAHILTD